MAETNKIAVDAVCAQFVHVRFITAFCGGGTGCVPSLQRGGGGGGIVAGENTDAHKI
jgi:hypothetical protein